MSRPPELLAQQLLFRCGELLEFVFANFRIFQIKVGKGFNLVQRCAGPGFSTRAGALPIAVIPGTACNHRPVPIIMLVVVIPIIMAVVAVPVVTTTVIISRDRSWGETRSTK